MMFLTAGCPRPHLRPRPPHRLHLQPEEVAEAAAMQLIDARVDPPNQLPRVAVLLATLSVRTAIRA